MTKPASKKQVPKTDTDWLHQQLGGTIIKLEQLTAEDVKKPQQVADLLKEVGYGMRLLGDELVKLMRKTK